MPYMHKAKWGAVQSLGKRTLVVDPHLYSAAVGTIREAEKDADGERKVLFWRSKTRCSSTAEWMELHDAQTGEVLWRAEARFSDRATPVNAEDGKGGTRTEFLTVVRLYLEAETEPRLMIVHRDTQAAGLKAMSCSRSLAVYMLDPGAVGSSADSGGGGASLADAVEKFSFMKPPAGEDIFQLNLSQSMTTVSLTSLQLPDASEMEQQQSAGRTIAVSGTRVRTLARLKVSSTHEARKLEIDGGLDLPLVVSLLCATDQLLVSHEAIDYDVEWPSDFGYAQGECFSSRKKEADDLKATAEFGVQTGMLTGDSGRKTRSCFCF